MTVLSHKKESSETNCGGSEGSPHAGGVVVPREINCELSIHTFPHGGHHLPLQVTLHSLQNLPPSILLGAEGTQKFEQNDGVVWVPQLFAVSQPSCHILQLGELRNGVPIGHDLSVVGDSSAMRAWCPRFGASHL